MKSTLLVLMASCLFIACKKDNKPIQQNAITGDWGMVGTVGDEAFTATSLNGSVIYHKGNDKYEMNINAWNSNSNTTVFLSYKNFGYSPGIYQLKEVNSSDLKSYKNDYAYIGKGSAIEENCKSGYIIIDKVTNNTIRGSFSFITTKNTKVQGEYVYDILYPVDTTE